MLFKLMLRLSQSKMSLNISVTTSFFWGDAVARDSVDFFNPVTVRKYTLMRARKAPRYLERELQHNHRDDPKHATRRCAAEYPI